LEEAETAVKSAQPFCRAAHDEGSMDDLFNLVYAELRRIAGRQLRGERPAHTLCATALVHEAWCELAKLERLRWQNRGQFLALAAQAMRRVLIDYAVARGSQKRGGGQQSRPLEDALSLAAGERPEDLIALDEALQRLGGINERCVRVVECRFYGGMSIEETASALAISPATVKREWTVARAWLNRDLAT
jgi:RNA polymerase sigma factor (TIGR02999 family)